MESAAIKKPLGVTFLSLYHMLSGFLILSLSSLAWVYLDKLRFFFVLLATPGERFFVAGLIASVVLIVSGVMMWRGDRWGYYLGSFHYLVGTLQNISTLFLLPLFLTSVFPNTIPTILILPWLFYCWYGIQAVVQVLIYFYFFQPSVRTYFSLQAESRRKFWWIELSVCLGIVALGLIYSLLQ